MSASLSLQKSDLLAPALMYLFDTMVRNKSKSMQSVAINVAKQVGGNALGPMIPSDKLPTALTSNVSNDELATGLVYALDSAIRRKAKLQGSAMEGGKAILFDKAAKYICQNYGGGDANLLG